MKTSSPSSSKRTIVHLIQSLGRGGCEKMLLDILPPLSQDGWENIVITLQPDGALEPQYREAGIQVLTINHKHLFDIRSLLRLRALLYSLKPELVCTYLVRADIIGRFLLPFFTPAPIVPHLVTTYNHPRYRVARLFEWLTKPWVKQYLANSFVIQDYYEHNLGIRKEKITAIPSGVNPQIFENADVQSLRKELHLSSDDLIITCVANLASNKGQHFLLDAFNQAFGDNPHTFLLLVGEGEERERLFAKRALLRSKERILFLGRRGDVPNILAGSDIFVLPTLFEGMSIALLEAMAAGKAIITTNIPENRPLFPDERFACLVSPQNISALTNALTLLAKDAPLRYSLGQKARERAKEHFSLNAQVSQLSEAFHTFAKKRIAVRSAGQAVGKKRIVHIIQSLGNGGCENMLLRTLPVLDNYEHYIVTLKEPGPLSEQFLHHGIAVRTIGMRRIVAWRSYPKLFKVIRNLSPDIVFTYLLHADIIGRLLLQRKFHIPIIPFLRTTYNHPRYRLARLLEWLTKPLVKQYLANSEAVKDFYVKHIGVQAEKITVIPNGIDISVYGNIHGSSIVREFNLPENRFVITCVANLAENKGHRYLLEAFETVYCQSREKENKVSFLLLIGDGPEKENLQNQIRKYQSRKHVFFLGLRTDIPNILKASNCFVLPTLFEGMSNALLEAMAAGLPVITTDIPENRILITNEKNGMLIMERDSQTLAKALSTLEKNILYSDTLAQNAKVSIQTHFSLKKITAKWEAFLSRFI